MTRSNIGPDDIGYGNNVFVGLGRAKLRKLSIAMLGGDTEAACKQLFKDTLFYMEDTDPNRERRIKLNPEIDPVPDHYG